MEEDGKGEEVGRGGGGCRQRERERERERGGWVGGGGLRIGKIFAPVAVFVLLDYPDLHNYRR